MPKKEDIKPASLNRRTPEEQKQTMDAIKSRGHPVGGAEEVKIPPLDAEPMKGPDGRPMTMHQQAEALRDPTNPVSPYYDPRAAEAAQNAAMAQQQRMDPRSLRTARGGAPFGGTLPPEAARDPNFRPGVGSAYAANQPGLANRPKPQLSGETVEGIEALHEFNRKAAEAQKKEVEESQEKETPAERLAKEMGIDDPDQFFKQFRDQVDEMNTPELRKAIEDRCDELSIEQLIEEGELRQAVPIVRSKLIVTYRTISGEEDLSIKRRMYGTEGGDQYIYDLLSMSQLTAGLYAINNRPLPSHLDDARNFNQELFQKKFKIVKSYPLAMLASLSINFTWFDNRTRKLFVDIEPLKNG
jgi:hypothetical protein